MSTVLPRNYTLDDLLRIDPITRIYDAVDEAKRAFMEKDPQRKAAAEEVQKHIREKFEADPSLQEKVRLCPETDAGYDEAAKLLGISVERLREYEAFGRALDRAMNIIDDKALIRSWRILKTRANIRDIGEKNFPKKIERPMLVLFSADWCPPCRIVRPTFARLVRFFDKAEVRYCHEDEWRRKQGIAFIPQFCAYFPNGAKVTSYVGWSAKGVWETMNKLITLGQSYAGTGELQCTDESCTIVPGSPSNRR